MLVASDTTDWLTATSTLVLAVFTIGLVLATGLTVLAAQRTYYADQLKASEDHDLASRSLQIAGAQIMASYRPFLIEVSPVGPIFPDMGARQTGTGPLMTLHLGTFRADIDPRAVYVHISSATVIVSVPLRNVGPGLAIIDPQKRLRVTGPEVAAATHPVVHRPRIPPGETTRIDFEVAYQPTGTIPRIDEWAVWVEYTDFRSVQPTLAILRLDRNDPASESWHVADVISTEVSSTSTEEAEHSPVDASSIQPDTRDG